MDFSKKEKNSFLATYLGMLDLTKLEKYHFQQLRTGASLLDKGIEFVGIERVKKEKTYNARMEGQRIPDHTSNILIIIEKAKSKDKLMDELAAYLVKWGNPKYYRVQQPFGPDCADEKKIEFYGRRNDLYKRGFEQVSYDFSLKGIWSCYWEQVFNMEPEAWLEYLVAIDEAIEAKKSI